MLYGVIFFLFLIFEDHVVLGKTADVESAVTVTSENEKLIFSWPFNTKSALVKINKKWWLVFDAKAKQFYLPRDRDLPIGMTSLKNLFDLPCTHDVTIFELHLHDGYQFMMTKKNNQWILQAKELEFKSSDQQAEKTDAVDLFTRKIAFMPNDWVVTSFKTLTPYKIISVDEENINILYTFVLTQDPDMGIQDAYETPYMRLFKSSQGAAFQRYTEKILLKVDDENSRIDFECLDAPKSIPTFTPSDDRLLFTARYSEIFKPFPLEELEGKLKKLRDAPYFDKINHFDHLKHAWLELLNGDETRAMSFLGVLCQYYAGIEHHPFLRAINGIFYILDRKFQDAYKKLRFLPNTLEIELFRGVAQASIGFPKSQVKRLRAVEELQKNYPQKFREEFMISVLFALLEAKDYKIVVDLTSLVPLVNKAVFEPFYKYLASAAKGGLQKGPFGIVELTHLIEGEKGKILNVRLKANIQFTLTLMQLQSGKITKKEAIQKLRDIHFMWRGDYLELNVLNVLINMLIEEKKYVQALKMLSKVRENFPEAFKILHFDKRIEIALTQLFVSKQYLKLSPLKIITLFDDNKEFIPDTEDGNDIIRTIGNLLLELDLLDQAAELLSKESMNASGSPVLAELYIKIAGIHVDNNNGEAALSILQKIPPHAAEKLRSEILNKRALAYAVLGDIPKALDLLESEGSIKGLEQVSNLLIKHKMWQEARERLFRLVIQLENDPRSDMKMDALLKLAMINVLMNENDENQVLKVTYKNFLEKQKEEKRKVFNYLVDDTRFTTVTRDITEEQLATTPDFQALYKKILSNNFQMK